MDMIAFCEKQAMRDFDQCKNQSLLAFWLGGLDYGYVPFSFMLTKLLRGENEPKTFEIRLERPARVRIRSVRPTLEKAQILNKTERYLMPIWEVKLVEPVCGHECKGWDELWTYGPVYDLQTGLVSRLECFIAPKDNCL